MSIMLGRLEYSVGHIESGFDMTVTRMGRPQKSHDSLELQLARIRLSEEPVHEIVPLAPFISCCPCCAVLAKCVLPYTLDLII
jgi:hypothetical protein